MCVVSENIISFLDIDVKAILVVSLFNDVKAICANSD